MAKALWQITDFLKEKGYETEFDKDSRTLFMEEETALGDIQTRYYYDDEMEVLSCQCIYTKSLPKENIDEVYKLINMFNSQIGIGCFIILEQEDVVFEINHLADPATPLHESVVEKLCNIPQDAMAEHLTGIIEVANGDTAQQVFDKYWM